MYIRLYFSVRLFKLSDKLTDVLYKTYYEISNDSKLSVALIELQCTRLVCAVMNNYTAPNSGNIF